MLSSARRAKVAVAAAGFTSFALLYAPQAVLPQLAGQYRLDPGGAALAVSVATGALAISVLPIAALSEAIGRRPVIIASVVLSSVLGLLLPLMPNYSLLLVLRAVQGVAIAGFPGVATAYLVERLGKTGVAAAVGAMIAGNTVGGMTGRLATGFTMRPVRLARRAVRGGRDFAGLRGRDGGDAAAFVSPDRGAAGPSRHRHWPAFRGAAGRCCSRSTPSRCWPWARSSRCTTRRGSG